mgnify:FL=1
MMDPRQLQALASRLASGAVAPDADMDTRVRQGRLSFAATIAALRSACSCEACQYLRMAIDIMLADAKKELVPDGANLSPRP